MYRMRAYNFGARNMGQSPTWCAARWKC